MKQIITNIKQYQHDNPNFIWVVSVLLSIPLDYKINSAFLLLFFINTVFNFKKTNFRFQFYLIVPLLLYLLMFLSYFWSIAPSLTWPALSKELSLLVVPICFWMSKPQTTQQKNSILAFYSYGILLYAVFYLTKASIRYYLTQNSNVFFYHELVTKDVNAIHVSVYVAMAFFYFLTKPVRSFIDFFALSLLLLLVLLLSSINIIVAFFGLVVLYYLFYTKLSKKMRLKNLIMMLALLCVLPFVGKTNEWFKHEYETMMTDSTINDVISKNETIVYNVSIKQAWTNKSFRANDFFPGTAFRVYQFRIFLEMLQEDAVFWTGYGLNASYPKIEAKGIHYKIYLGTSTTEGYQKKNFHNQYVQNFAELGIFGFLLLVIMLFINIKNALVTQNFIQISFAFLMISLFLTESFLWRQRGVVFFTTMYCLFNIQNTYKFTNNNTINTLS